MPVPALFGIAGLGTLIVSAVTAAMKFVMVYFTVRTALRLAAVGITVSLIVATYGQLLSLIQSVEASLPSALAIVWSWIVPGNLHTCILAIVSAELSVLILKVNIWAIKLIAP